MHWIALAWTISLVAATFLGYYLRGLKREIEQLTKVVQSKVDKQPEPEEPKSTLIDPDDPVLQAKWQREEMLKRMNHE